MDGKSFWMSAALILFAALGCNQDLTLIAVNDASSNKLNTFVTDTDNNPVYVSVTNVTPGQRSGRTETLAVYNQDPPVTTIKVIGVLRNTDGMEVARLEEEHGIKQAGARVTVTATSDTDLEVTVQDGP